METTSKFCSQKMSFAQLYMN